MNKNKTAVGKGKTRPARKDSCL